MQETHVALKWFLDSEMKQKCRVAGISIQVFQGNDSLTLLKVHLAVRCLANPSDAPHFLEQYYGTQ